MNERKLKYVVVGLTIAIVVILIIRILPLNFNNKESEVSNYLNDYDGINYSLKANQKKLVLYFIQFPKDEIKSISEEFKKYNLFSNYFVVFLIPDTEDKVNYTSTDSLYMVIKDNYYKLSTTFSIGKYATVIINIVNKNKIEKRYTYLLNPYSLMEGQK